jgi:hypothetical protein
MKTVLTGTRAILTAAAVVVAFAGFYVLTQRDGNNAQVSAIWSPSPRPDGVSIYVTIGRSNKVDKLETVAPFNRAFPAVSGEIVRIRARLVGSAPATLLGCSVVINGISQGIVECYGVVP